MILLKAIVLGLLAAFLANFQHDKRGSPRDLIVAVPVALVALYFLSS